MSNDKLAEMIDNAELQLEGIESSLQQIDQQIDELNEEITGVQDGMCFVVRDELIDYLQNTKIPELEASMTLDQLPLTIEYGPLFGTINYDTGGIEDFIIIDATANTIYEIHGIGWDNDLTIIEYIDQYDFGNDYLTRPLTSGATYGLIPNRNNLNSAKSLLLENKNKIEESVIVFESFAS